MTEKNEVIYASTLVAEEKWLKEKVSRRAEERRLKRTRKSKKERLKLIKKAIRPLALDRQLEHFLLSFCKRRGFDYTDKEETENRAERESEEKRYSFHRDAVIKALSEELQSRAPARADEVLEVLTPLLNRQIRPKRFLNRNTSKCQWQDCTRNTPKKANSVEETLILELYPKLKPFLVKDGSRVENSAEVEEKIEAFIKEAKGVNKIQDDTEKNFKTLCDGFKKGIRSIVKDEERFDKIWKKARVRENLKNIILGKPGGRQTFCREHVEKFKEFFLAGKEIPKRDAIKESDLTKRQEILFSKLFAFVKGRLLPLTKGNGVSEITVERNAFDVVPRKVREKQPEDKLYELYWYGPMYNFGSERDMFFKEFNSRCAYCNNPIERNAYEIEHIFNRANFPMDGYLNKVPSCQTCNRKKGGSTAIEARMPIHPEAYLAYERYLEARQRRVPTHFLMNAKKGILNLLKGANGGFWGEQPESNFVGLFTEEKLVRMLGRDLVSQARTQASARMLARYLATKLEGVNGLRPKLESFNSRYVAHIRHHFCPDFSKGIEKKEGNVFNHALDAAILSCKWPSPNIHTAGKDGKERWEFDIEWNRKLQEAWPANIKKDGTLELPAEIKSIQGFEEPLNKGGFFVNLSNTNWNQREIAVADQTIYCVKGGKPAVRKPARDWLDDLKKEKSLKKHIEKIVHSNLRTFLLKTFRRTDSKEEVEKAFKGWLRRTIERGLIGPQPSHPSSLARWDELKKFVEGGEDIPSTVGLRLVQKEGIESDPDIKRMDKGEVIHVQRAQPSYKYFLVAYNNSNPNKQRPLVLGVKQSWRVEVVFGDRNRTERAMRAKKSLEGRAYRDKEKEKEFLVRWKKEIRELLGELGYKDSYKVSQGNVILYEDGSHLQLKNFKRKNKGNFRNVKQVYPSPYRFLLKNAP